MPRRLHDAADTAAYRILQEALTNAVRHGDGTVHVQQRFDASGLALRITNPMPASVTCDPVQGPAPRGGHGLTGMRERTTLLGGTFDAGPVAGAFVVIAHLPDIGCQT